MFAGKMVFPIICQALVKSPYSSWAMSSGLRVQIGFVLLSSSSSLYFFLIFFLLGNVVGITSPDWLRLVEFLIFIILLFDLFPPGQCRRDYESRLASSC